MPENQHVLTFKMQVGLRAFDEKPAGAFTVEQLKENEVFCLKNGRTFKKLTKIRKRYRCVEVKSGLIYLFSPIAEVFVVESK